MTWDRSVLGMQNTVPPSTAAQTSSIRVWEGGTQQALQVILTELKFENCCTRAADSGFESSGEDVTNATERLWAPGAGLLVSF